MAVHAPVASGPSAPLPPLDGRVENSGRAWAAAVRAELVGEGRRAAGGWPGTLSEARGRLEAVLRGGGTPPAERERLARLLYHTARDTWLASRDAPDEE